MNRSESIAKLTAALGKARIAMGAVVRDSTATVKPNVGAGYTYHYATLAVALEACEPALQANGLAVLQTPQWADGALTLETMLCHDSGEWILSIYPIITDLHRAQSIGSCITYARRCAYLCIVGKAPEDDDGEAASGRGNGHASQPARPAPPELNWAEINRASHKNRYAGQRGHLAEAPAGWGNDVAPQATNGNGHTAAPAAPAKPSNGSVPMRGSQLWKWASAIERDRGKGIMAYLEQYGESRGWGSRLTAWSDAAVREAYPDALAELEVIYDHDQADDHDDGGDDGRYDDRDY